MKQLLLLIGLLPFAGNAQIIDPRTRQDAPMERVRSIKTTTFFIAPKTPTFLDTGIKEMHYYTREGFLMEHTYAMVLDKGTFTSRQTFDYSSSEEWVQVSYENGAFYDSAFVNGDYAIRRRHITDGRVISHVYEGDSCQEIITTGKDSVFRSNKWCGRRSDLFWDYQNAGTFATKNISESQGSDTVRYLDASGKVMAMVVNHYSESRHDTLTEYFNFIMKKFVFVSIRYNANQNMVYYLKRNKSVPSYRVERKFDSNGLITEERIIPAGKRPIVILKKYEYTYY